MNLIYVISKTRALKIGSQNSEKASLCLIAEPSLPRGRPPLTPTTRRAETELSDSRENGPKFV